MRPPKAKTTSAATSGNAASNSMAYALDGKSMGKNAKEDEVRSEATIDSEQIVFSCFTNRPKGPETAKEISRPLYCDVCRYVDTDAFRMWLHYKSGTHKRNVRLLKRSHGKGHDINAPAAKKAYTWKWPPTGSYFSSTVTSSVENDKAGKKRKVDTGDQPSNVSLSSPTTLSTVGSDKADAIKKIDTDTDDQSSSSSISSSTALPAIESDRVDTQTILDTGNPLSSIFVSSSTALPPIESDKADAIKVKINEGRSRRRKRRRRKKDDQSSSISILSSTVSSTNEVDKTTNAPEKEDTQELSVSLSTTSNAFVNQNDDIAPLAGITDSSDASSRDLPISLAASSTRIKNESASPEPIITCDDCKLKFSCHTKAIDHFKGETHTSVIVKKALRERDATEKSQLLNNDKVDTNANSLGNKGLLDTFSSHSISGLRIDKKLISLMNDLLEAEAKRMVNKMLQINSGTLASSNTCTDVYHVDNCNQNGCVSDRNDL